MGWNGYMECNVNDFNFITWSVQLIHCVKIVMKCNDFKFPTHPLQLIHYWVKAVIVE